MVDQLLIDVKNGLPKASSKMSPSDLQGKRLFEIGYYNLLEAISEDNFAVTLSLSKCEFASDNSFNLFLIRIFCYNFLYFRLTKLSVLTHWYIWF